VPLDGAAGIDGDAAAAALAAVLGELAALDDAALDDAVLAGAALDEDEDEDEHAAASNVAGIRTAAVPTRRILLFILKLFLY
jgi:hypothetical protein